MADVVLIETGPDTQCQFVRLYDGGYMCCRYQRDHEGAHQDFHSVTNGPWYDRRTEPCNCGHLQSEHNGTCGFCAECDCDGYSLSRHRDPVCIGWRVVGRAAHLLSWFSDGPRDKYYTACGKVMFLGYVDDNPTAKHCVKCERALAASIVPSLPSQTGSEGDVSIVVDKNQDRG